MCTLILAWQVFADAPVVVATNRDEALDRPSEPPTLRDWGAQVVAPKDERADGTWLGYNEHGVAVVVTNRWLDSDVEGERSRGLLVRDALGGETAEDAVRAVERELDERTYDGFNLVVVDENAALFVENGPTRRVTTFDPGVHVVVNVGANGAYTIPAEYQETGEQQAQNADTIRTVLQPEPGEQSREWLDRTAQVLGDHEYGVCVHRSEFGTKSSTLISVRKEETRFEYADGPPCETSFESVTVPF